MATGRIDAHIKLRAMNLAKDAQAVYQKRGSEAAPQHRAVSQWLEQFMDENGKKGHRK